MYCFSRSNMECFDCGLELDDAMAVFNRTMKYRVRRIFVLYTDTLCTLSSHTLRAAPLAQFIYSDRLRLMDQIRIGGFCTLLDCKTSHFIS